MSRLQISRSKDLQRLRDEGFHVTVRSGHLTVQDVPYVTSRREVARGVLVATLTLSGNVTARPGTHVIHFAGEYPCDKHGAELAGIRHRSRRQVLAPGLVVDHSFSSKPPGGYTDYYDQINTYAAILSAPAASLDPNATPRTFPFLNDEQEEGVFNYVDTATSRAGIGAVAERLIDQRIGVVGVGGTGAYVLDLVSKTPVREIAIFDADYFLQHNAFRTPGAATEAELLERPRKVEYLQRRYSSMHRRIVAHAYHVDRSNVDLLRDLSFVFVCLDSGQGRRDVVSGLERLGIPFVDVGMGLYVSNDALGGVLRVTTSTPRCRDHVRDRARIPLDDLDGVNEAYSSNIQLAELNAFNAAQAVIKWKKICGFYLDLEGEHFSTYTLDGNVILNEEGV